MAFDNPSIFFFTKEPDCAACNAIAPTWECIKNEPEFANIYNFEKYDVVNGMDLAASYYVDAAPTFVLVGRGATKRLVNPGATELRQEMRTYLTQATGGTGTTGTSTAKKTDPLIILGLLFPFSLVVAVYFFIFKNKKNGF